MSDEPLFVPLPPDADEPTPPPASPPRSFEELSLPGVPAVRTSTDEVLAVAGATAPVEDVPATEDAPSAQVSQPAAPAPVSAEPEPPAAVAAEPPFAVPPAPPGPPSGGGKPPAGRPPAGYDDKRMTLIEHLEELRHVLIVSLSAWGIASLVGLAASHFIVLLLTQPLNSVGLRPVVLSPLGVFTIHLKVGLIAGFVVALPVILRQVWSFVAPGLKPEERRFAGPLLFSSLALFALGGLMAFGFMFIGIRLIVFTNRVFNIQYLPELNSYLGTMLAVMISFAITFEFPVALVLLAMVGLVSSAWLRQKRRVAYLVIAAVGYAVTPGVDPVTPLALIVPLLVLFEGSILVIRRMGK